MSGVSEVPPPPRRPRPGELWRHYKRGDLYRVILLAKEEGTGAELVVYAAQSTGQRWCRAVHEFIGRIPSDLPRFTLVEDAHPAQLPPAIAHIPPQLRTALRDWQEQADAIGADTPADQALCRALAPLIDDLRAELG